MMMKVLSLALLVGVVTAKSLVEEVEVGSRGIECDLCDDVIQGVGSILKSEESTLVGYLQDICSILPSSDQSECTDLIKQFGPQIIDYLISEVESKDSSGKDYAICNSIIGCGSTHKKFEVAKPEVDICAVCKDVLGELDDILNNPSDQSAIEQQLEKLCPSAISALCNTLIGTEGGKLLDWLAKELDPTTVCSAIDAC